MNPGSWYPSFDELFSKFNISHQAMFLKVRETTGINEDCKNHLLGTMDNFLRSTPWALRMFDASTKFPSSIMMGNIVNLGNYEECLDVDVNEQWGSFIGQHCIAIINIPMKLLPVNITKLSYGWSVCTPSTCLPSDVEHILKSLLHVDVRISSSSCHTRNTSDPFHTADWIAIILLIILGLLSLLGTIHSMLEKHKGKENKYLILFSWYKNSKALFSTKSNPNSLEVLHGIRFLSIAWIVLGHVYQFTSFSPLLNYADGSKALRNWQHLFIGNSVAGVDTFFLLSGLLLSYVLMKGLHSGHRFNFPIFYLHRFMRVTPVLGIIVLLQVSLIPRLSSGPLWNFGMVENHMIPCIKNWWSTMLYVQNYVNTKDLCIVESWYLAVDMQLYLISPLFLLTLYKNPKVGVGLLVVACFGGILLAFGITYIYEDRPSYIQTMGKPSDRYYHTHMRYVPWAIGILFGYIMFKTEEWRNRVAVGTERLPKIIVIIGWTISTTLFLAVAASLFPFQQENYVNNPIEAALYVSLTRPLWALATAWVIFACSSGYGGFVNAILTWPLFRPLSRLTYSIYLIHLTVIVTMLSSARIPSYPSDLIMIFDFFGYLTISILLSIVMVLMVESPIIALEKLIFRNAAGARKTPQDIEKSAK